MRSPTRSRAAVVVVAAVVLGLAVQPWRELPWTDAVGTVAYATAAVGVVALLIPRRGPVLPAAIGTAATFAVELAQLTAVPARINELFPPAALLLGRSFDPLDLCWLLVGGALGALALGRPRVGVRARRPQGTRSALAQQPDV